MADLEQQEIRGKHLKELLRIVDRKFLLIVRIDLLSDTGFILQNAKAPERVGREFVWRGYLYSFRKYVDKEILDHFTSKNLLQNLWDGKHMFSMEFPYQGMMTREWLTVCVYLGEEEQKPYAELSLRFSTKEHQNQNIMKQCVYNKCDFLFCLDLKKNSYMTLGMGDDLMRKPPKIGDNYSIEMMRYIRTHVMPEDRVRAVHELSPKRILEQLETQDVYSFTCGISGEDGSYCRKRYEYQYYDRSSMQVLLLRTDITGKYLKEKEKHQELLDALSRACEDSLTGLLNHQGTIDEVTFHLREDEEGSALMFIDMDNFKSVNDTLGHLAGDKLLRRVAQTLKEEVPPGNLVGRVGGDEFLVFLRNVQQREDVLACAERLNRKISAITEEFGLSVSCCIGIAMAPEEGTDYKTLTASADKRLYRAKLKGKNCFVMD